MFWPLRFPIQIYLLCVLRKSCAHVPKGPGEQLQQPLWDCCVRQLARFQREQKVQPAWIICCLKPVLVWLLSHWFLSVFADATFVLLNAHLPRVAALILFSCQEQQHQNSSHLVWQVFFYDKARKDVPAAALIKKRMDCPVHIWVYKGVICKLDK